MINLWLRDRKQRKIVNHRIPGPLKIQRKRSLS